MNKARGIYGFLVFSLFFGIVSCDSGLKDIDKNIYQTVKFGDQLWMAENLNVSRFRNGDSIPEAKSPEEWVKLGEAGKPAWCYMENDQENGKKFGKLYNWYAAVDPRGLSPNGWHVATDDDWTKLVTYFGGGVMAALQIRTTGLMDKGKGEGKGFSGVPGGCRNNFGKFYGADSFGYWWSSTESNSANAWIRILNYVKCDINTQNFNKIYGTSIRCIRN